MKQKTSATNLWKKRENMPHNAIFNSLKIFFSRGAVLWTIIASYPLLFLWQGLNFSDEGNALTVYRLIFTDPESVKDTFGTWGANVLGGLWLKFFGGLGLLGLRFAGAMTSVLTVIVAYFIFRKRINKKNLLLGIIVSFLFSYHFFTLTILGYNNLSVLFFALAILFLASGLEKGNKTSIFFAGFVLSLNVFVRLPNILGLLFVLAIPFSAHIKNVPLKEHLKRYFVFIFGIFFGFAAVFSVMKILGHVDYYIESLNYLIGATQINHGPYGGSLLFTALAGYLRLFFDAAIMLVLVVLAIAAYFILKFHRLNFLIQAFLLALFSAVLYANYDFIGVPIGGRVASLLTGLCYASLIFCMLNRKKDGGSLSVAAFLLLVLFIVIPVGSGAGFVNSLYVIPLAFPVVFNYIVNFGKTDFSFAASKNKVVGYVSSVIGDEELKKAKTFLFIGFILYALTNALAFSYDDSYNRFSLNAGINSPLLRGVYTTKEKAEPLNELLLESPRYVKKGDTILVVWIAPVIYYLTETKPYFPHPWTEIYGREQVVELLKKREKEPLPVVIRHNHQKKHEYDDVLYDFFKNNSYEKKWGNGIYEIYVSGS